MVSRTDVLHSNPARDNFMIKLGVGPVIFDAQTEMVVDNSTDFLALEQLKLYHV